MNSYCKRQVLIFYRLAKKNEKKTRGEGNDHLRNPRELIRGGETPKPLIFILLIGKLKRSSCRGFSSTDGQVDVVQTENFPFLRCLGLYHDQ